MYYPGLFETASPYSGLVNTTPFKPEDSPTSVAVGPIESQAHTNIITASLSAADKRNKMVSNLSASSLTSSPLTQLSASPFARVNSHQYPTSHYGRTQAATVAADCSMITPSPYVSASTMPSHLASSEPLPTSLLHEQSFLESSTHYGIGPLPAYSAYPNYISNSVINSALSGKTGSTTTTTTTTGAAVAAAGYSPHNSFYAPGAPPYHSLYSDSLISDYIARNHHIDSSKAVAAAATAAAITPAYNIPAHDNNSFLEHLKRLQESFQSNSPKFSDNNNQILVNHVSDGDSGSTYAINTATNSDANQTLLPKSSIICSKSVISANHASATVLSPLTPPPTSLHDKNLSNNVNCDSSSNLARSSSAAAVTTNHNSLFHESASLSKNQLLDLDDTKQSIASPSSSMLCGSPVTDKLLPANKNDDMHRTSDSLNFANKANKSGRRDRMSKPKPNKSSNGDGGGGVSNKATIPAKRNRANDTGRNDFDNHNDEHAEATAGHAKIKKRSKQQKQELRNPDDGDVDDADKMATKMTDEKTKNDFCDEEQSPQTHSETKDSKDKSSKKVNNETLDNSMVPPKELKTSKKSNGNSRRRRFRSGLDMIRNSRKKTPAKAKPAPKKDQSIKDLRLESKRLIVNKSLGETLLHRSARNNRLDVVKFCLQSNACDVNARDNAGYTPLHECSSRGNLEVARLLLENSADVNASATGGIRPLHDAIENNHLELVRLLLSYGADPNISTYSGSTPLQLCRSKTMFKFLKGFYSDISTERTGIDSDILPWKCIKQPSENGFDVLEDVPSESDDFENCEFLYSVKPIVPLYRIMHGCDSSFYLFCDVLAATGLNEADFHCQYPKVEISKIAKAEFVKATLSQLEKRLLRFDGSDQDDELSVIHRDAILDDILQISATVI